MSNTVAAQHPAVVLRSTYQHLRALLAIALIAIIGLTVAVVVIAANSTSTTREVRVPPVRGTSDPATHIVAGATHVLAPQRSGAAEDGQIQQRRDERVRARFQVTAPAIRPNASPRVEPNPDRKGPQPQARQPGVTTDYPGHY